MNNCLNLHRVLNISATTTNLVLNVSNSTNIGNGERFKFYFPRCRTQRISDVITGAPLPVLINVNGANIQLINANKQAVLSNKVPRRSDGRYIVPTTGEPYIQLYNSPACNCKGNS